MMQRWYLMVMLVLPVGGCTDAEWDKTFALGENHTITLYSGGKAVRTWRSTGKVKTEEGSDGYYFRGAASQELVRVTGDLVVEVD